MRTNHQKSRTSENGRSEKEKEDKKREREGANWRKKDWKRRWLSRETFYTVCQCLGKEHKKSDEEENEDAFPSSSQNQHQQQQQQQQQNFALVAKFGFSSLSRHAGSRQMHLRLLRFLRLVVRRHCRRRQNLRVGYSRAYANIDIDAALLKSNADSTTGKKKKNNKGTPLFSSSIGRRHV